jgi:hypothetical protein
MQGLSTETSIRAYASYLNQRGHRNFGMDLLSYSEWHMALLTIARRVPA